MLDTKVVAYATKNLPCLLALLHMSYMLPSYHWRWRVKKSQGTKISEASKQNKEYWENVESRFFFSCVPSCIQRRLVGSTSLDKGSTIETTQQILVFSLKSLSHRIIIHWNPSGFEMENYFALQHTSLTSIWREWGKNHKHQSGRRP